MSWLPVIPKNWEAVPVGEKIPERYKWWSHYRKAWVRGQISSEEPIQSPDYGYFIRPKRKSL